MCDKINCDCVSGGVCGIAGGVGAHFLNEKLIFPALAGASSSSATLIALFCCIEMIGGTTFLGWHSRELASRCAVTVSENCHSTFCYHRSEENIELREPLITEQPPAEDPLSETPFTTVRPRYGTVNGSIQP